MIAYKVVTRDDRRSCIAEGIFEKTYRKGSIVTAHPKTLGIFCFSSKKAAESFTVQQNWMIIKVDGIGEPVYPKVIIHWWNMGTQLTLHRYQDYLGHENEKPPRQTICFKKVKVLE